MESGVTFTAEEKGFIVEAEGKKLRVSYDEFRGNHEDAMKFCKERGGGDETVENLRFIARHRDAINEELRRLDKEYISSLYWSNEVTWSSSSCMFTVGMRTGFVFNDVHYSINTARAISVL